MINKARCIIPHDRELLVTKNKICPAINSDDLSQPNYWLYFKDETGEEKLITTSELGALFGFEYLHQLLFLHEADLRHVVFDVDYSSECQTPYVSLLSLPDLFNSSPAAVGCTHIRIQHIGVIAGQDVGYGAIAARPIATGEFIGEYLGIVQTSSKDSVKSSYSFSYPTSDGKLEINGTEYGNICRFLNHSDRPNSIFARVYYEGMMHVACVSCTCDILRCSTRNELHSYHTCFFLDVV
jgi:hypothetical protein